MTLTMATLHQYVAIQRERLRKKARKNTAAFVALYRDFVPGPQQYEMAARCDNDLIGNQSDFWPRDHGKTEVFVVGYPLRRICNDPNIRILIVQKTGAEAAKSVGVIKTELEENAQLRRDYAHHWQNTVGASDIVNRAGMVDDKNGAWQTRRIYVKRTRKSKDPTVESVGVGGAVTGGHFDIIICDDILDDENTRTPDRCQKIIDWFFGTIFQLREPHTKTIVVGTLKTLLKNLYSELAAAQTWNVTVRSALLSHHIDDIDYTPVLEIVDGEEQVTGVEVHTPNIEVMWPEAWPIEALLLDMLGSPRRTWRREKLNDIQAMGERIFKRSFFRYYTLSNSPRYRRIVQSWDTAYKKTGDPSALTEWGEASNGVYLRNVWSDRIEWPELSMSLALFYYTAPILPDVVLIEDKASGQSAIQSWRGGKDREAWLIELRNYRQAGGAKRVFVDMIDKVLSMSLPRTVRLPVVAIKVGTDKSKEQRFEDASVWWSNGQVYHPESNDRQFTDFETELTTLAPNDDRADSAAQAVQFILAGRIKHQSGKI